MASTMPANIQILEKKTVFQGYFRVDRYTLRHGRFDGGLTRPVTREVFERGHAAALLPYDPIRGVFVLCEQFRVGAYAAGLSAWQLEIVAGIIEEGETPDAVVRRETQEEAGLHVSDIWPISHYLVSPGGTTESVHLYLGRVSAEKAGGVFGLAEEDEDIRVKVISESELNALLENRKLTNAPIILAAQWFFLHRDAILAKWKY